MYVRSIPHDAFPKDEVFDAVCVARLKAYSALYTPHHFKIYGIFQNDNTCIGFWYMYHYSKWGIRFCITPPGLSDIGLQFITGSEKRVSRIGTQKEIFELMAQTIYAAAPDYTELTFPYQFQDMQALLWLKFNITPKYTYHLNLQPEASVLLLEMSSELRRSIQNCNTDALHIRNSDGADVVLQLLEQYSKQKKIKLAPQLSLALMKLYINHQNGVLYTAYCQNELIAFAFFKTEASEAQYLFGAHTLDALQGVVPVLFWRAILDFKTLHVSILDFEGSMIPDVERFYRKFGGTKVIRFNATKSTFKAKCYIWVKQWLKA